MAVLTCSDMVTQCLEGQPSGWKQFVSEYLPFAATVLDRHFPRLSARRDELLRELLLRVRDEDARFFRDYSGHSEREFLMHLREYVLGVGEEQEAPAPAPEIPLEWDVFDRALTGLSALERQMVWMFLLSPNNDDTDQILRVDPKAVTTLLARAQEGLRAACDRWNPEMLAQNRHLLDQEARARRTKECPAPKVFLRALDGQITWRDREELDRHLAGCWHCVDQFCRFREILFLSRRTQPLPDPETEAYLKVLGIEARPPSRWKCLLGKP
ncbi:MAG: hypothetical protein HY238_05370 [Acidobacteria bacterium]|nr:hypothetical protein [Acidobacteriota bacterium]